MDKIQEELEKGCGAWSQGELKGITFQTQCGNDKFTDKICLCEICQAKLSQHLATKQAMIKEFEKMIDEQIECDEHWISLGQAESLKQKLGELKT